MTQNFETEWTEMFNSSSLTTASRTTFSEAVDKIVGMVWSNETERLDRDPETMRVFGEDVWLLDEFICHEHRQLWYSNTTRIEASDDLDDYFHSVVRKKVDEGLYSRFTCVQANFRRRHCLIKMIREMNEKCCRGTGFYCDYY